MNKKLDVRALAILGLMTALLILFSFTPIGTIPIGPLSITLNVIPIAMAAIALGPVGGLAMGCVFGLLSFLQCIGVGIPSGMGAILFSIDPFLAFIQRFIPRALDGFLVGLIFRALAKKPGPRPACFIAGFCSAFLIKSAENINYITWRRYKLSHDFCIEQIAGNNSFIIKNLILAGPVQHFLEDFFKFFCFYFRKGACIFFVFRAVKLKKLKQSIFCVDYIFFCDK